MDWDMFVRLKGLILGFKPVRCRVCKKLTEPSIYFGNLCSVECFELEEGDKN